MINEQVSKDTINNVIIHDQNLFTPETKEKEREREKL